MKMCFVFFIYKFLFLIIIHFFVNSLQQHCHFDQHVMKDPIISHQNYAAEIITNNSFIRNQRFKREYQTYQPLRININYMMDIKNNNKILKLFKEVFNFTISKARDILSVIPVQASLLLKRVKACKLVWNKGLNKGKCSKLIPGYKGEFCGTEDFGFQLPNEHLEGVQIFNYSYQEPLPISIPNGQGVHDTDFILYVYLKQTDACNQEVTLAHSSYCQLDQFNRPVAGYINICPIQLKYLAFNDDKLYTIVLHELFHILGFSFPLFQKYEKFSGKKITVLDNEDIPRLILPSVIRETQKHFNCNKEDFGGPLFKEADSTVIGSHWHSRFLYGSIMTTENAEVEFTFLDRITFAVFEDSGWYKVNYSFSDTLQWGKNQGCNFGLESTCSLKHDLNYGEFCSERRQFGCDYLHLTESKCISNFLFQPCFFYFPNISNACEKEYSLHFENLSSVDEEKRCFLIKKGSQNGITETACFQRRCIEDKTLEIKINNSWITCIWGLTIPLISLNETYIICPTDKSVCRRRNGPPRFNNTQFSLVKIETKDNEDYSVSSAGSQSHYSTGTVFRNIINFNEIIVFNTLLIYLIPKILW